MTQNNVNNAASELTIDNIFIDGNTVSSLDTNGNIILAPNGSGSVSITDAAVVPSGDRADSLGSATNSWDNVYADGVTFDDGTNIMDAYIGSTTWTPTLIGSGTAGLGTYSTQTGYYIRIGKLVYVSYAIIWSAHTGSGNMQISNLPVSTSSSGYATNGEIQFKASMTLSGSFLYSYTSTGSDLLNVEYTDTSGGTNAFALVSSGSIRGSTTYFTD